MPLTTSFAGSDFPDAVWTFSGTDDYPGTVWRISAAGRAKWKARMLARLTITELYAKVKSCASQGKDLNAIRKHTAILYTTDCGFAVKSVASTRQLGLQAAGA